MVDSAKIDGRTTQPVGRDRSVAIETCYGLLNPGIFSWWGRGLSRQCTLALVACSRVNFTFTFITFCFMSPQMAVTFGLSKFHLSRNIRFFRDTDH